MKLTLDDFIFGLRKDDQRVVEELAGFIVHLRVAASSKLCEAASDHDSC
jgi:hypothetical protein